MPVRRGRPTPPIVLSTEERKTLEQRARSPSTPQAAALRARIVLACADGWTNRGIAVHLRVSRQLVGRWRERFLRLRLSGLENTASLRRPRKATPELVQRMAQLLTRDPLHGRARWTIRAVAEALGVSRSVVWRSWSAARQIAASMSEAHQRLARADDAAGNMLQSS